MKYYIALDGGGTKLHGILFDENGNVYGKGVAPGINKSFYSNDEISAHTLACLNDIFTQAREKNFTGTCIECVIFTQMMENVLASVNKFIFCEKAVKLGEGAAGVLSCGKLDGICAVSGTGSDVFLIRNASEVDYLGGWGYLLSDDGSGAWIGKEALRSYLEVLEGIKERTLLHKLLEKASGISDKEELLTKVYTHKAPPAYTATFCKAVNEAASSGDTTAIAILERAGALLGDMTCKLIKKHTLDAKFPICLAGSVFRHCNIMRASFIKTVCSQYTDADILLPTLEPIEGAMLFGIILSGKEINEEIITKLKNIFN